MNLKPVIFFKEVAMGENVCDNQFVLDQGITIVQEGIAAATAN
ncbi:hypothetical protein FHS18_000373 [Paenibacillus phyllosphaerae]|uniref:Uncharacterized protein n=1 Tax=Paenibacillus phyllosphaerae TaxID=274593 RepID=A0A7W5AT77_9BACL|nr:hypothetical protein [Paenibacillus phyllosphaerae]